MLGRLSLARLTAFVAATLVIAGLGGCTPQSMDPMRMYDPHPGLPKPSDAAKRAQSAQPPPKDEPEVNTLWGLITGRKDEPTPEPTPVSPDRVDFSPPAVEGGAAETLLAGDPMALRFLAMQRLAQAGVITMADAVGRARANLGALLPLTQPAPAVGLDHPIPPLAKVIERAKDLAPDSKELQFLLDNLLPAAPTARAPLFPHDKAAARILDDRLQRLEQTGLITLDEALREDIALKELIDSDRLPDTAVPAAPPPPPPEPVKPKGKGGTRVHHGSEPLYVPDPPNFEPPKLEAAATGNAGVHLMSIPDPAQGDKAWTTLKSQYPELAPLTLKLERTDLGDVGVTWRLIAGPLAAADARKMCETLKARAQECTPTPFPK